MKSGWKLTVLRIFALLFVLGVTVGIYLFRHQVRHLEMLGYPGIFLLSILSSATILLPVPGVLLTSVMGVVFNPFWVAIAAGLGAALGELSGYLAGFSGQGIVERAAFHDKLVGWMRRFGPLTIVVLAFIPNPLFDMAGMVAGALKMPLWIFLICTIIGKIGKMMVFAYGGAGILSFFKME
jgi:membrane protein YqaA with SNARE-associated domain